MKTFVKICLGVFGFGLVLTTIGFAFGGRALTPSQIPGLHWAAHTAGRTLDHWGGRHWRWEDRVSDWADDFASDFSDRWDDEWDDWDETWDSHRYDDYEERAVLHGSPAAALPESDYDSVTDIELRLGEGRFELRPADLQRGKTPYTVDGTYFKHLRSGMEDSDTWVVDARGSGDNERIMIYLPADAMYREVDIELGAGSIDADALQCDELKLSVGAGSAELRGVLASSLDVEVGAGRAKLELDARWADCGYDAEVGLGSISVNGKSLLLGVGEASRGGSPMLDLEAGAGTIDITTTS